MYGFLSSVDLGVEFPGHVMFTFYGPTLTVPTKQLFKVVVPVYILISNIWELLLRYVLANNCLPVKKYFFSYFGLFVIVSYDGFDLHLPDD